MSTKNLSHPTKPHPAPEYPKLPAAEPEPLAKPSARARVPPMLKKVAERSIVATDQEIREYIPTELCVQIAESMLSGQLTQEAIAKQIGVQPATVGRAMRNPIFCGWVSTTIHRNVRHRIGMVDAALTNRALGGDVRAMELFYKRFGKLVQRAEVIHSQGYDYAKMTDADLEAMAKTDLNS